MDLERLKSVILNQINGVNGLYSLQLQNHIYGCFVLMEDIAQSSADISDTTLTYSENTTFNYDTQFSEIGIKYGFVNSDKVTLTKYNSEYKEIWMNCFRELDLLQDIALVDEIEDIIINLVCNSIPTDDAFFYNALESGTLSEDFINKVMKLLEPPAPIAMEASASEDDDSENMQGPASASVTAAANEKYIKSHRNKVASTRKKITRKLTPSVRKRVLQITRKHTS
jgi:hypothetical protein